jgi:hypothetical protein
MNVPQNWQVGVPARKNSDSFGSDGALLTTVDGLNGVAEVGTVAFEKPYSLRTGPSTDASMYPTCRLPASIGVDDADDDADTGGPNSFQGTAEGPVEVSLFANPTTQV